MTSHSHPQRHGGPDRLAGRRRYHHPVDAFDHPDDAGHRGRGPGRRHGGRGRAPRGDVRAAVLMLLAEEPMHGYQLMQAIADRSNGRWTPSPGAIYPALAQLEDEGLVTVTAESGRKVAALTDAGRALVADAEAAPADPFGGYEGRRRGPDLRDLLEQLHGATRQVGRNGTEAQVEKAAAILTEARRSMYLLLADGPETDS
ncbi:MAG: PadR family transcriptional regulator [Frankiales bacterium]|nr:PadR family transcriptional regulator [Frankiales bacterium]